MGNTKFGKASLRSEYDTGTNGINKIFVLIGGFLGAGKTTVTGLLAQWLSKAGLRSGLITNDQAEGLIDSALGKLHSASVQEVAGGCFCCKAEELGRAISALEIDSQPDVFIAEPVGSCTDLMATVLLPLKQIYPFELSSAPMSVLIDAARLAADWFPNSSKAKITARFSADVQYIFDKQMEEAEWLVLNKVDLLSAAKLKAVMERLEQLFPTKRVFQISTRSGKGLDAWFSELITARSAPERLMELDYERYAAGEAMLGWFNAKIGIHSRGNSLDANRVLLVLAKQIQAELEGNGARIAHFKMSLSASRGKLAVVNAVRAGDQATVSRRSPEKFLVAEMLINLRAEAEPELLDAVVNKHLSNSPQWHAVWKSRSSFKPGKPTPTHRVSVV